MYYVQGPILGAREDTDINKNRKLIIKVTTNNSHLRERELFSMTLICTFYDMAPNRVMEQWEQSV